MQRLTSGIMIMAFASVLMLVVITGDTRIQAKGAASVAPGQGAAMVMPGTSPAPMRNPHGEGFTAGTGISITFSQQSYSWKNTPQTVMAVVTVSGGVAEEGTNGDVSVSGPGTILRPAANPSDPPVSGNAFTLPDGGSQPLYVTLPLDPGAYTYTATLSRHVQNDPHRHEDISASVTIYIVAASHLEYQQGGGYQDVPNPLIIACGSSVTFKVIPNIESTPDWPVGKPVWGGSGGANGTGETITVTFNTAGTFTVSAECGNSVTANVTVVDFSFVNESCYVGVNETCSIPATLLPTGLPQGTIAYEMAQDGYATIGNNLSVTGVSKGIVTYGGPHLSTANPPGS